MQEDIKLYQGDCLEVLKTFKFDESIDMILTDLPYGITSNKWDSVIPLEDMWKILKKLIKPNGAIILHAAQPFTTLLISSNIKMYKYSWIWKKTSGKGFLLAKKQPLRDYEDICVFYKHQCIYNPQMRQGFKPYVATKGGASSNYKNKTLVKTISNGERYPLQVLEFDYDNIKLHPTQKPLSLIKYLIKTYTNKKELVLDFTMGSGTTGEACVDTKRKFIGIEKEKEYFDIAKKRIDNAIRQATFNI